MAEHRIDDPDDPPAAPPVPDADRPVLAAEVVTNEDRPAECTIYPRDADEAERLTTWLTAEAGSFVDAAEMR